MRLAESSYKAVDRYARRRMERGDVFGWAKAVEPKSAILLVRRGAELASFPNKIAGVRIQLREVSEPRSQD